MGPYQFPDGTTPNICIVGAGFSGLTAAIKLKKDLGLASFQIYDENSDVGGTWLVNTYPGVECDVQSHMYSWSFEPNPNWSKNFSPGSEIWQYIRQTAIKYDLYSHIRFNTKVSHMEWEEHINQWRVTTIDKETQQKSVRLFDLVIAGPGALRIPNRPKEFDDFTGPKIHTAEWDDTINLEGKIVGVVGSGASAVQVITSIAPKVKELHCYQRKPAWIVPRSQFQVSETTKWLFKICPPLMWLYRCYIFIAAELRHKNFTYGSWLNILTTWLLKKFISRNLPPNDPKVSQLTPTYTLGCKRIIKSSDYYPALGLPHVTVITDKIAKVGKNEIITEAGQSTKLDVLILATGFNVQDFFSPMTVIGQDGIDLMANWKKDEPTSYYGICTSTAPNTFFLLGPNTALGHNSVVFMIECQVNFTIQIIREMMTRNSKRVTVKPSAEDEFLEIVDKKMKTSVWYKGKCDSWYANSRGHVTTLWPLTCTSYWLQTRNVDHSKFAYN